MSRLKRYSFIGAVKDELTKLGVEYVEEFKTEGTFIRFNHQFLLALSCYMTTVAQKLLADCKEDIRFFGFEYVQAKWSKFITSSLAGGKK